MRVIAILSLCLLAGCNTMNGLGQDMQNAGANLSSKAQDAQPPPPPAPAPAPQGTYPSDEY